MLSRRTLLSLLAAAPIRAQDSLFGDAEAYERFMGRWSRALAPLLVDFARVPDTGRVLDVGSGTGALAFSIAGRKPHVKVVGIDPATEYVAYAKSKNPYPDRTSFEVGDAQAMSFPDGAFQSSLSLLVFNFIPDPSKALREMRRVTRPGGTIAASVWDYGARMKMLRIFWDAAAATDTGARSLDEKRMPLCRAGELSRLWKSASLTGIREQPQEITMTFPSFSDYWDPFLLGQGPAGAYVRTLRADRLQRLRAEVKRRLRITSEGAAFSLIARVWSVRGTVPGRS